MEAVLSSSDLKKAATLARSITNIEQKIKDLRFNDVVFQVGYDEELGEWIVHDDYCEGCQRGYGGGYYGYFQTRAQAYRKAKVLTLLGEKNHVSGYCDECSRCYTCGTYLEPIWEGYSGDMLASYCPNCLLNGPGPKARRVKYLFKRERKRKVCYNAFRGA